MIKDSIFQEHGDKKRVLTKDIIRDSLFKEAKFYLIQNIFTLFIILVLCIVLVFIAIRNPGVETILFSILFVALMIFISFITVRHGKECVALSRGEFTIRQDRLINIKPHQSTWKTRTDGVYHKEDVFFFESGIKFVHTRITPTQKDLTLSANCGDMFYLVFLDRQPSKPKYIYNSQTFEYRE